MNDVGKIITFLKLPGVAIADTSQGGRTPGSALLIFSVSALSLFFYLPPLFGNRTDHHMKMAACKFEFAARENRDEVKMHRGVVS
jgi:hypothetical protein